MPVNLLTVYTITADQCNTVRQVSSSPDILSGVVSKTWDVTNYSLLHKVYRNIYTFIPRHQLVSFPRHQLVS